MSAEAAKKTPAPRRDPTLRELRATLSLTFYEIDNRHGRESQLFKRIYDHMAWLLDAYLFDVDETADDGGRDS